ncbi:hypothetical protein [uncultured Roseivirga sp.]|uniref:hypothetical protein n=1 Tax=uncultured Roseivirga sp. TaxID=543088 RepID=UPI0030DD483F|tara:strand:- start:7758 stop:8537 length:780 start_codon:yes stop_codon:yes gene_type:complete
MKRYLSIFTLSILSFSATGQDILTKLSGETITGDVKLLANSDGMPYAIVKNGKDKEKVELFSIKNISLPEIGLVKPIKVGEQYRFGLLEIEGYLSVYKYSTSNRMDDFGTTALQKFGGSTFVLPGIVGFRKLLSDYLSDCPEVSDKIDEKELKRNDIDQIVNDYNACIALKNSIEQNPISYNTNVSNISESKQTMLKDFEALLKYSEKVEDKDNVIDMFSDFSSKLNNGEKASDYLINAIKNAIKNDKKLVELMNKIIN